MTAGQPRYTDAQRRERSVARHRLDGSGGDPVDATTALAALHSSDPATPFLSCRARMAGFATADLDDALYGSRQLCRVHAMRRTLVVVPTDDLPAFLGATVDVAQRERSRVEGWLEAELGPGRVERFLDEVEDEVIAALHSASEPLSTRALSELVPRLATELTLGSGKWAQRVRLSSRLLFVLAMQGRVIRARPTGSWRASQYRWADVDAWLGAEVELLPPGDARREVVRRYLRACGPVTSTDVRWWTGFTAAATRAALADVDAVTVTLADGEDGFVLPDDLDADGPATAGRVVSFLPALDATPMGWKQREWFCAAAHATDLYDGNGNIGPTVWVDGRVVGGWAQAADGEVVVQLLEEVGDAEERVRDDAARLTEWFDGVTVTPRFPTPLARRLASP